MDLSLSEKKKRGFANPVLKQYWQQFYYRPQFVSTDPEFCLQYLIEKFLLERKSQDIQFCDNQFCVLYILI